MNFINRNEIANGVYFTNIKDSRFKTMKISVNIVVPLSVETASENALVGGLLVRSCKICFNIQFVTLLACEHGSPLQIIHNFHHIKSYVNKQTVS